MLYVVNLYTQSDVLHSYGCIDSTVLCSYGTNGVLTHFCYLFVLHGMYCINLKKLYILQIRTCFEILALGSVFSRRGALLENFSSASS